MKSPHQISRSRYWLSIILMAGAALLGTASRSHAQAPDPTDTYTNSYDIASSTTSWIYWYGVNPGNSAVTWDSTMDAANDPASGSMLITMPFGANGDQQVWFGTFGNQYGYDGTVKYNGNQYTNITVDIHVDPNAPLSSSGDFGVLQIGLVRSGTPDGGGPFSAGLTIPASATNGWVRLVQPVATGTVGYDDPGVIGVSFRYTSYSGYPTNPITFWMDNVRVEFAGTPPPPPPPPTMSMAKAVNGLNLYAGGGGDFDRQSIRTLGTDIGFNYSWIGQGSTPVTYSFTVVGAPGANHQQFQTHMFLVPAPLTDQDNSAPDYQDPNVLYMDLDANADGSATWVFRWKTNAPKGNGQLYSSPLAQISNPSMLGTWSLAFVNDTNVTMTAPSGSSTNFMIDPSLAALFPNPIYAYFGVMPDNVVANNKGQAIVFSEIKIQGSIDTITNNFLDYTPLDTVATWMITGSAPQGIFVTPPDLAMLVSWTAASSAGFALQTNSVIGDTNSFPWSTNGLPAPLSLGLFKRTLLTTNDVPVDGTRYFRVSKPGF